MPGIFAYHLNYKGKSSPTPLFMAKCEEIEITQKYMM